MCNVCEDLLSNIQGLYATSLTERNSQTNFEAPAWRFRWSRSPPWCDDWMSLALQGGPRCHPKSPPRFASMYSPNTAAPSKTTRGQNRDLRLRENATRSGTTGWDRRWDCQKLRQTLPSDIVMKIVWRIAKFKLHMQVGRNKKVISRLLSGL